MAETVRKASYCVNLFCSMDANRKLKTKTYFFFKNVFQSNIILGLNLSFCWRGHISPSDTLKAKVIFPENRTWEKYSIAGWMLTRSCFWPIMWHPSPGLDRITNGMSRPCTFPDLEMQIKELNKKGRPKKQKHNLRWPHNNNNTRMKLLFWSKRKQTLENWKGNDHPRREIFC